MRRFHLGYILSAVVLIVVVLAISFWAFPESARSFGQLAALVGVVIVAVVGVVAAFRQAFEKPDAAAQQQQSRERRLTELKLVDEWLDAVSSSLTLMRYSIQGMVQDEELVPAASEARAAEDAKRVDDQWPRIQSILEQYPNLKKETNEITQLHILAANILTRTASQYVAEMEKLGTPNKKTRREAEKIASKYREALRADIASGLQAIDAARGKLISAHAEVARLTHAL